MSTTITSPKIFISYSWKPFSNKQKTIQLAERLTNDGVTVIIDEWSLSEGQDKYQFMEQMVSDPEIKRVLLICNKEYATKANSKKGGVGIESLIISDDIYTKAEQTKFIPVIFEKDEKGIAYTPTFVKTRIFIDLSTDDIFEDEYEKIIRNIFEKPLNRKPALGTPPAYIFEEEPTFLRTAHKVNSIKTALINERKNYQIFIDEYYSSFIEALSDFEIPLDEIKETPIDEVVLKRIESLKVLRNDFINFLEVILTYSFQFDSDKFISFYERLLEFSQKLDSSKYPTRTHGYMKTDQYRFFYYELFLYSVAILWEKEKFDLLGQLLHASFVVADKDNQTEAYSFILFNQPNETLTYRNNRLQLNRVSIVADLIKQRADNPKYRFEKLQEFDSILYYIAIMMNQTENQAAYHMWHRWWPNTTAYHIYTLTILQKLISQRYFDKIKIVFGVATVDELKAKVQHVIDIKADRIQRYQYELPLISNAFKFDKIATVK